MMIPNNIWHVSPVDDLREHDTTGGTRCACWCKPRIEECENVAGGYVVVHNSMDRREEYETGERKSS